MSVGVWACLFWYRPPCLFRLIHDKSRRPLLGPCYMLANRTEIVARSTFNKPLSWNILWWCVGRPSNYLLLVISLENRQYVVTCSTLYKPQLIDTQGCSEIQEWHSSLPKPWEITRRRESFIFVPVQWIKSPWSNQTDVASEYFQITRSLLFASKIYRKLELGRRSINLKYSRWNILRDGQMLRLNIITLLDPCYL